MATTNIFTNGRVISIPGSYSEIDATGLEAVGLGATGIVALIGEAEGGRPVSEIEKGDELRRVSRPEVARQVYRSGDLREVADMVFAPSSDPQIPGGAQQAVMVKVNPSTRSTATLSNDQGAAVALSSKDFGAFTEQANISIADGTSQGKLVTISFEDQVEAGDNIGGDNVFTLRFNTVTTSKEQANTMVARVVAGGSVEASATMDVVGIAEENDNDFSASVLDLSSAVASDTRQVEIFGLDDSGDPVREVVTLNGTTEVTTTNQFTEVMHARVASVLASGVISIQPTGTTTEVFDASLNFGQDVVEVGGRSVLAGFCDGTIDYERMAGSYSGNLVVWGFDPSGARTAEAISVGPTNTGSVAFSRLDVVAIGQGGAGDTIRLSYRAAKTDPSVQNTLQRVLDFFNARTQSEGNDTAGFSAVAVSPELSMDPSRLDVTVSDTNVFSTTAGFAADVDAVITWINANSQIMTAERVSGATGKALSNTPSAVFLSGGVEGSTTFADWQKALDLLQQLRVNTIVPLTSDPAVHAAVKTHCEFMGGVGRSERDAIVGIENAARTGNATKAEIKSQTIDLNTRHVRVWPQSITRFNVAGQRTVFKPHFGAALLAGMQAGSPAGTSLTFKRMNVLDISQDASWNPTDDGEELVNSGAVFAERVDGSGIRIVRNVTTYQQSRNIAFIEASVNEAVNTAAFTFRNALEFAVGRPGFASTLNAVKGIAINTLGLLVDAGTIVSYRNLSLVLNADVLEVSVEMAPAIPINFVKTTIHLNATQLAV